MQRELSGFSLISSTTPRSSVFHVFEASNIFHIWTPHLLLAKHPLESLKCLCHASTSIKQSFETGLQYGTSYLSKITVMYKPAQVTLIYRLHLSRGYCSQTLAFNQRLEGVSYASSESVSRLGGKRQCAGLGGGCWGDLCEILFAVYRSPKSARPLTVTSLFLSPRHGQADFL